VLSLEVARAIRQTASCKATGPDEVPAELFKAGETVLDRMHRICAGNWSSTIASTNRLDASSSPAPAITLHATTLGSAGASQTAPPPPLARSTRLRLGTQCHLGQVKCSPYLITDRRVPEMIPVLGSQAAGDVSHKPGGRLILLSARPTVTPATLKKAATNFATW